jgi:hypothetical protein
MYGQPGKQGTGLVWRESIDLKHGHRMGANWLLPKATNHELRVAVRMDVFRTRRWSRRYLWKFPSKALMELPCELSFVLVALVVVDCVRTGKRGLRGTRGDAYRESRSLGDQGERGSEPGPKQGICAQAYFSIGHPGQSRRGEGRGGPGSPGAETATSLATAWWGRTSQCSIPIHHVVSAGVGAYHLRTRDLGQWVQSMQTSRWIQLRTRSLVRYLAAPEHQTR